MDLQSLETIAKLDALNDYMDMNEEDTQIELDEEVEAAAQSETQTQQPNQTQPTQTPRKRRKTSTVWDNFVSVGLGNDEKERAKCIHCWIMLSSITLHLLINPELSYVLIQSIRENASIKLVVTLALRMFSTIHSLNFTVYFLARIVHLRGKSFWSLPDSPRLSWNWKCLLRLRDTARPFVACKLGNGCLASFWFDTWTPLGPLITLFGANGPTDWRVPLHANVASVFSHLGWRLPSSSSPPAIALHAHLSTIRQPLDVVDDDLYSWVIDGSRFQC
ncbi:unnamed protein product, partial [Arabidopsis halleri]